MYQQYPPPQPAYYGPQYSGCMKLFMYGLSLWIPLAGIIIGLVYKSRLDQESQSLGQTCLILGIVSFALNCCLSIGIVVLGMTTGMLPILLEEFGQILLAVA